MANTVIPVVTGDGAQLVGSRINAGKMRCSFQTSTLFNTFNNTVRAVALAGVRTIGHRNKFWFQAAKTIDGVPQGLLHFTGTRREKLERNVNLPLDFCQTLIQGIPLAGVKKAHTLPHQSLVVICCVVNIYPFRRPDVKMKEKRRSVNRKMTNDGEEKSGKMRKIQDGKEKKIRNARQTGLQMQADNVLIASCRM